MPKTVENGDSLKRQRELSPSNNINKYEGLKKRKAEKLLELFGDATLPDSKIDVTNRKKSSIIQNTKDDISSNSGIGFLDALNIVTSVSNKKIKKNKLLFKDDIEKRHTISYKSEKPKIRADDYDNSIDKEKNNIKVCSPKNDNKSLTSKTTIVNLKNYKTKNQSVTAVKEKVEKTDENQSQHNKKYEDKKEGSKIAKITKHQRHKKNKSRKHHRSAKEENIAITKKQHKHIKKDEKNNETIIDKQKNKYEGKEKISNKNISKRNFTINTEEEISSSSGIGFAEALEIAAISKNKLKKIKKK